MKNEKGDQARQNPSRRRFHEHQKPKSVPKPQPNTEATADYLQEVRERINARIGEAMSKYFDGGYSGHVTIARDGSGFRTECAVHLDSKITLEAEGMAPDPYASADQAAVGCFFTQRAT